MDAEFSQVHSAGGTVPFEGHRFHAHVELLRLFLKDREQIVERIGDVLNASRKPVSYLQDRLILARHFEDCFFASQAVTAEQMRLRGQLEEAHWASGFRPRQLAGMDSDLIHPAELMIRGFHFWQHTRWPGRNRRARYANTLFNAYLLRCLQLLSMRIWDQDPNDAGGRLREAQDLLDGLWGGSPDDQPVIVRDARWLIPLAQSLPTDDLAVYFEVARQVAETLAEADALEVQKAHVRMLGGHLTSQIRHLCMKDGLGIDEPSVMIRTRTSNALDFALLVQGLVALLRAYGAALHAGDEQGGNERRARLDLAGAIFQGISPDPELFLNRGDLLRPYSMIEHVFITSGGKADAGYSALGERHVRLLEEYGALMNQLAGPLHDDLPRFRPVEGACSPYGVVFGWPSTLTELMAFKTVQSDAETRFSLEDVFRDDFDEPDTSAAKLAWVNGWRRLPHVPNEIQRQYDYPYQFAVDIYNRMEGAFRRRDSGASPPTGRLYVVDSDEAETASRTSAISDLPARYFRSSDTQVVAANLAEPGERAQLLRMRQEGHYLVSYETPGGWVALVKEVLEEVLGAGRSARIAGLPRGAADALRLMCADLVITEPTADPPPLSKRA